MRNLFLALAAVCGVALVLPAFAADDKKTDTKKDDVKKDDKKKDPEIKLSGKLVCTKCKLQESEKCGNALLVGEGDKAVKYYLDDAGAKEAYHKDICQGPKDATVTGGELTEKEGKKMIKGAKVEFTKEKKDGDKKDDKKTEEKGK